MTVSIYQTTHLFKHSVVSPNAVAKEAQTDHTALGQIQFLHRLCFNNLQRAAVIKSKAQL